MSNFFKISTHKLGVLQETFASPLNQVVLMIALFQSYRWGSSQTVTRKKLRWKKSIYLTASGFSILQTSLTPRLYNCSSNRNNHTKLILRWTRLAKKIINHTIFSLVKTGSPPTNFIKLEPHSADVNRVASFDYVGCNPYRLSRILGRFRRITNFSWFRCPHRK